MAKELNIAVLALHQLNRNPESRDDKRPTLSDLRNSGDLEQDADLVVFTYRDSYYLERAKGVDPADEQARLEALEASKNAIEILIAKNRNGPTCSVPLFCDARCNVVRDLAK
jgi:replicative DNA helicase